MESNCLICERISQIERGINPYFVKELETDYVVIGDYQLFRGYSLFLCKRHVCELHELDAPFRQKFLEEMSLLAEAVWNWVKPLKLNQELLGNREPHLHWHIFPRHQGDPNPSGPTWQVPREQRYAEEVKPSSTELLDLTSQLRDTIDRIAV